jgi:aspartyl-tRNA(Asn)/glutamyl-tRNA(Gln) amidotransferase subunit A
MLSFVLRAYPVPSLLTIAAAGAALRAGTLTARDLVDASLRAVETHNPRTNAFIHVDAAGARAAADAVDAERRRGVDRGPLHGMPISLKDLIDVAGQVTSAASRVLRDRVAVEDAPVVTRLREAGAVIIGKTNLHEFALGTTSEDSAFGPVRNPHDPDRSPGGSSGGSAAAVATGMGLASVGTDTGGSIRIPAAACGIVGLKPTHGEVPTTGVIPLSTTLDHVGPLALTVQDAAWMWAVLAGRPPGRIEAAGIGTLRLKRIDGDFDTMTAEVGQVLAGALDALAGAGCTITSGTLAGAATTPSVYANIVLPEAAHWHRPLLETRGGDYTPAVRERIERGLTITAVSYLEARDAGLALRQAVDAALDGCDALVLATLPLVAPPLGASDVEVRDGRTLPVRAAMLGHTQLFDITGHPAISLPIRTGGLPVGLQLVGRRGDTARLLAVAAACETMVCAHD